MLFEGEATTKNTKDTKKNKNYGFFSLFGTHLAMRGYHRASCSPLEMQFLMFFVFFVSFVVASS